MLYWLKNGEVNTCKELVKRLNRGHATITRWLKKYKEGGLGALLEVKYAPWVRNNFPNASDRLRKILQQFTPDFTASLIGWEFITAAILSSSS